MHLLQLVVAWLFPCAMCVTMAPTAAAAASVERERCSSPAFSAGDEKEVGPGSSPSASSSISLRTDSCSPNRARAGCSPETQGNEEARTALKHDVAEGYLRKIKISKWTKRAAANDNLASTAPATATIADFIEHDRSPSTTFAAGGVKISDSSYSPSASSTSSAFSLRGSPDKQGTARPAPPKGELVRRYLDKISRRMKGRRRPKGHPPPKSAVADDTAREREEAVASAVAHCKETLRRGTAPATDHFLLGGQEQDAAGAVVHFKDSSLPHSPSLDGWLLDMQEEGAAHGKCKELQPSPRRDGLLLELQEAAATSSTSERTAKTTPAATSYAAGKLRLCGSFDDPDFVRIASYFTAKYAPLNHN